MVMRIKDSELGFFDKKGEVEILFSIVGLQFFFFWFHVFYIIHLQKFLYYTFSFYDTQIYIFIASNISKLFQSLDLKCLQIDTYPQGHIFISNFITNT